MRFLLLIVFVMANGDVEHDTPRHYETEEQCEFAGILRAQYLSIQDPTSIIHQWCLRLTMEPPDQPSTTPEKGDLIG